MTELNRNYTSCWSALLVKNVTHSYSLLSRALCLGKLTQGRLLWYLFIQLQFTLTNSVLFHVFPSIFKAALYPVLISLIKHQGGDCAACMSQPECSLFTCACVAVFFSCHCYVLCWGNWPRARGTSACMGGSRMFLSSPGCFQEL